MNTQLIYVSKEKAEVQDLETGVFFNQVSQGIKVKQGDLVSIDGIAINSVGVGSDIIEIPEKTQDYNYYPNQMQLNSWVYIHHNYDFTVQIPLAGSAIYGTPTTDNYGWLNNTGVPNTDFGAAVPLGGAEVANSGDHYYRLGGKRMYMGRYTVWSGEDKGTLDGYDTQNPDPTKMAVGGPISGLVINVPGGQSGQTPVLPAPGIDNARVWEPLKTDLTISVDAGYDNPNNIANKITADFHSSDPVPQQNMMPQGSAGGDFVRSYLDPFNKAVFATNSVTQLTCSTQNSASLLIKGIPTNQSVWFPAAGPEQNAYYTSWIAAVNPFLMYYGSRLLTNYCIKNNTFVNARPGIAAPLTQNGNIVNVFDCDEVANVATWRAGYVFTTNLAYNEFNLKLVRDLLHSQKLDPFDTPSTVENLSKLHKDKFHSIMSFGRNLDAATGLAFDYTPLQPKAMPAANFGCGVDFGTTRTFFDSIIYSSSYLGTEALTYAGVRIAEDYTTVYEGVTEYPKSIARLLDCNLCAVDTGTGGGGEVNIGIIMEQGSQVKGAAAPGNANQGTFEIKANNPILVNLQYKNPNNFCTMVLNPQLVKGGAVGTAGDQPGNMNVGSPNINMLFDSTRGRFAMANMSWPLYTKATSAGGVITGGGTQIIKANTGKTTYGSIAAEMFLEYAQSGLGIVDLSVRNLATGEWEKIDRKDPDDILNKYTGSLWKRLGFGYESFMNPFGKTDAIYTERHWNSSLPLKDATLFPYPTTNNSQFDTALNISLNVGIATTNLPQFNLGTEMNQPDIAITAETALTYAKNLPQKLEFPYWLIQSDLIEGCDFNSENNGQEDNIMAVCNRAYLAGDFAFSFAPDYKFVATKDYVVTGIKTRVLNPDLSPAFISDKTAIIYKIESPIKLFTSYPKLPSSEVEPPAALQNENDALMAEQHI